MADVKNPDGDDNSTASARPPRQGFRKDGAPYKDGNTREDGSYEIGKNRTPDSGKFRTGDGRKRGRRAKGVKNGDTILQKELGRKIAIREGDSKRKVTKGHAILLKLIENAAVRGDTKSIEIIDKRLQRAAAREAETRYHTDSDHEILVTFLRERSIELGIGPNMLSNLEPNDETDDS